jgi:hypothetical protein
MRCSYQEDFLFEKAGHFFGGDRNLFDAERARTKVKRNTSYRIKAEAIAGLDLELPLHQESRTLFDGVQPQLADMDTTFVNCPPFDGEFDVF